MRPIFEERNTPIMQTFVRTDEIMKQDGTPLTSEAIAAITNGQELYEIAKTLIPGVRNS